MKNIFLVLGCLLLQLTAFSQDRVIIDKVVGTIGNEPVLLSDVEEQYALMSAQQGVAPENARCDILENLLAQNLLLNQARLDSLEVLEEEVDAQLNARIDRILAYMNNDISQFESYYGQTINDVKESFRSDLKNQILIERMQGQVMAGVTITPSQVKSFFNRIPVDSLPYFNSEVEIGEIVVKPTVNSEQKQIAISTLEEVRQRILDGTGEFAELARQYSDDPVSARAGGDLGWQKRGTFVPEFEATAYKLEKGEISSIIESEFGFHLIQLIERRGNSTNTRHILIRPEITDNDLVIAEQKLDTIRTLIETDSLTFSEAVKIYSDESVQSYNNDGRMVNPKTGNTFFETSDLDPEIYFTIDNMNVSDVSKPFQFKLQSGDRAFRIVQLQSLTPPHTANLQQDYSKIQKAALEEQKGLFMNDWIINKLGSTYINIDPMFQSCPNIEKWLEDIKNP